MQRGTPLPGLTGLRFFAAAWVLLYHANLVRESGPRLFDLVGHLGYAAVPLFYVLSGFVLAWNYGEAFDEGRASVGRFLVARAARIYPLHLLALAWALVNQVPWVAAPRPVLAVALGLHAWQPGWVSIANIPSWSVSNELFFYALFPFLIVLVPGGRSWLATRRGLWTLIGCVYAASFVPWFHMRAQGQQDSELLRFWPPFHVPEFLIGIAVGRLALLEAAGSARKDGSRLVLLALAGLLGVALVQDRLPYPLLHDGMLAPLYGMLVYGLARGGWAARPFEHRVIVRLGELGYAIYIFQDPVWGTMLRWVWPFTAETGARLWMGHLLYWSVLVGVAALASRLVETPVRAKLRDPSPRTMRTLAVIGAGLLTLAAGWTLRERLRDEWGPRVVVASDFQEELGCGRDWVADCAQSRLARVDDAPAQEPLYRGTLHVPPGTWVVQVALDDGFRRDVGHEQPLVLERAADVPFVYSLRERRLSFTPPASAPLVVHAPGSYQHLVGCSSDWLADCDASRLFDLEGDGILRRELTLPAGHYETKAVVGAGWDENYGDGGVRDGANVPFDVVTPTARVMLRFDPRSHELSVRVAP